MKCEILEVWKLSSKLSVDVFKTLQDCRDFGFKDQITRSGLSIPSNIAEGMEKDSAKEKVRFIEIAKGSTAEFATQTYIGMDIGYIERNKGSIWLKQSNHILSMLSGLKKAIKSGETPRVTCSVSHSTSKPKT